MSLLIRDVVVTSFMALAMVIQADPNISGTSIALRLSSFAKMTGGKEKNTTRYDVERE